MHLCRADPGTVDDDAGCAQPGHLDERDVVEVHELMRDRGALIQPGKQQQRIDQTLQPQPLVVNDARQLLDGRHFGMSLGELRVLPDRRQR